MSSLPNGRIIQGVKAIRRPLAPACMGRVPKAAPSVILCCRHRGYHRLTQGEAGGYGAGQGAARAMIDLWQAWPTPLALGTILAVEPVDDLGTLVVGAGDEHPFTAAGK